MHAPPDRSHPRKRRAPVWLLILAVVVLPLVGLFGWSFHQRVTVEGSWGQIRFERSPYDVALVDGTYDTGGGWYFIQRIPPQLGGRNYTITYVRPYRP